MFSPHIHDFVSLYSNEKYNVRKIGLSGLKVLCLPRDLRFVGSNSAVVSGFFQEVEVLSVSPSGGTLGRGS